MKIIKKLYDATRWSCSGLYYAYRYEVAFRLELLLSVILIPAAIYLADDLSQLLWLLFSTLLVLIVELLNTAIETVIDRVGEELHDLSKRAKDIGSAAVFCSLIFMIIVWGMFIWQHYAFRKH